MIVIKIDTSSAAFNDENGKTNSFIRNMETIRILKSLVKSIEENPDVEWNSVPLMDLNGNSVGSFCYDPINPMN